MNFNNDEMSIFAICIGVLCFLIYFVWESGNDSKRMFKRIQRLKNRQATPERSVAAALNLRRQTQDSNLPLIGKLLQALPSLSVIALRLDKAGSKISPERYVAISIGTALVIALFLLGFGRPPLLSICVAIAFGIGIPHLVVSILGGKRIKLFLTQFPDAIDLIVRGLRSGLPVTESMNMVGTELRDPIGTIFKSIGEQVKLGMSVEKALHNTGKRLGTTEFNFFVTSIILQRETGGNLSEILSNLSDVLRKRFMMKMKIKAMSSEAKASAIIVGSLPFVVTLALLFISPDYLTPLINDKRGNMALGGAMLMLLSGVGIMFKMSRFEI